MLSPIKHWQAGFYKDVEISSELLLRDFLSDVIIKEKFPSESQEYHLR